MSFAAPFRSVGMAGSGLQGYAPRKNRGQVATKGVTDPIPLQSGVTQAVRCTSDLPFRSQDPTVTFAPYSSDPIIHTVVRGEWAFARVEDFVDRGQRKVLANDSSLSVFTNANGLKITDKIKFVGCIAFESESKGVNPNADQAGTIYTHGTFAAINTGPDVIKAGDMVYIDEMPYMLTDKYGNKRNGIDFTPLSYPPNKFVFASYSCTSQNVNDQCAGLRKSIDREFRESKCKYQNSDHFFMKLQQIVKDGQIREVMPLYYYAMLYACRIACTFHTWKSTPAEQELNVNSWLRKVCVDVWEKWCLFYKTASRRQAIVTGLNDTDSLVMLKSEADLRGKVLANDPHQTTNAKLFLWVASSFEEVCEILVGAQTDYYASRKAGYCTQNSGPGMPLHMMLQRF